MAEAAPIAVFVSGSGTNLQAILDDADHGRVYRVARVVSDRPGAFGLTRARDAGVATAVVERSKCASADNFDRALLAAVEPAGAHVIALAGFMRILGPAFVAAWHGRLLNIHPSLLPRYKGLDTYARVLAAGDAQHGTSVHYVTEELDGGPVIAQAPVHVDDDDTADTLRDKVQAREYALYPRVIALCARAEIRLGETGVEMHGEPLTRPLTLDGERLIR